MSARALIPIGVLLGLVALVRSRRGAVVPDGVPVWLATVVPNGRVLSDFGPRDGRVHHGIDIAAPLGSPVYSPGAGRVVDLSPDGARSRYGNLAIVELDDGPAFVFAHLGSFAVELGDRVRAGTKIGVVGNTQRPDPPTRTPHVHIETVPTLVRDERGRAVLTPDMPARIDPAAFVPVPG